MRATSVGKTRNGRCVKSAERKAGRMRLSRSHYPRRSASCCRWCLATPGVVGSSQVSLALKRPVSAPLARGMEVEPTPELCAALRSVHVGGVRTLTTYCLRGGSTTRKMACVKFRREEQREASFLARADADREEEDKFEEFRFAVNVLGLLPFGWGNQTDRTFPTEKEAVIFCEAHEKRRSSPAERRCVSRPWQPMARCLAGACRAHSAVLVLSSCRMQKILTGWRQEGAKRD